MATEDASALLVVLFDEPGSEGVAKIIDDCAIHAVNLAETMRELLQIGVRAQEAVRIFDSLELEIITTLSAEEALAAGTLAFQVREIGLSTGDCVWLSVAALGGRTAVTADKQWGKAAKSSICGRKVRILQIR